MKTITRKTMLYRTGVEYGDYTMNHVQGCAHGCTYPCYAYLMKKRFGQVKDYDEWITPCLVENTLELLDREIPKYKDDIKSVQLCFTTDPFMVGYKEVSDMSLKAIEMLNTAGIKCTILTKGILPHELKDYSSENFYGITLITLDEEYRKKTEPFAAPILERLNSLKLLHEEGCKTWVSIEPYPTPNLIDQSLSEILEAVSFVDKIVFGRTNYSKSISEYKDYRQFYNECASKVTEFCYTNSIACHIKKGTAT